TRLPGGRGRGHHHRHRPGPPQHPHRLRRGHRQDPAHPLNNPPAPVRPTEERTRPTPHPKPPRPVRPEGTAALCTPCRPSTTDTVRSNDGVCVRAVTYRQSNADVDTIQVHALSDLTVFPCSVLVEVRAGGVNPDDWKAMVVGLYALLDASFPGIPG